MERFKGLADEFDNNYENKTILIIFFLTFKYNIFINI